MKCSKCGTELTERMMGGAGVVRYEFDAATGRERMHSDVGCLRAQLTAERTKREEAEREVLRLRQIVEHWNLPEGPGDTVRPRVRMIAVLQHLREQGSVGRVATGYEYADELEAKFGRD